MSDDPAIRAALANLDESRPPTVSEGERLWGLLSSLHRDPQLREWITLESAPLVPLAQRNGDNWVLNALVATVRQPGGTPSTPWAWIAWSWPAGRLLAMADVRADINPVDAHAITVGDLCTREHSIALQAAIERRMPQKLPDHLKRLYDVVLSKPLSRARGQGGKPESTETPCADPGPPPKVQLTRQEDMLALLAECRELLRDEALKDLLPWWRRVQGLLDSAHFDVAVAGEFSRGKSTLINRLIDAEVLSVGDLPTTAMPARVRFGESTKVWLRSRDGRRQEIESTTPGPDSAESLQDGLHEVEVPSAWLREAGLQLVDTPGAGAPDSARSAFATEVIAASDATLVAVSATMPLSLTERAFIEQEVLGGAVPRIAVVVTRLDQVGVKERGRVLAHITEKVADWAPDAEVWSSFGPPTLSIEAGVNVAGVAAMRERLSEWSSDPEHQYRRLLQLSAQLEQLLAAANSATRTRIEFAQRARSASAEDLQEALQKLSRQGLQWEQLRGELGRRELAAETWLEEKLREGLTAVGENLAAVVRSQPNPREWWETEFATTFKRQVGDYVRRLEGALQNRIAADSLWLAEKAQAEMEWSMIAAGTSAVMGDATSEELNAPGELADLTRSRMIARVGVGAVTLAAYTLAAPLGMAVGIGGGLLNERLLSGKLNEQRAAVIAAIKNGLEARADEVCLAASRRLRGVYARLGGQTEREEMAWKDARVAAAEQGISGSDHAETEATATALLEQVARLQARLTGSEGGRG